MPASALTRKHVRGTSQQENARAKARTRVRDARIALNEPAHVIAQRARLRYQRAQQPARIPSKKPRLVSTPTRQDRSVIWVMRLFALGIVISLFAVVSIQTTIAKRQITIDSLRTEQKKEINKFQKIRHDIAELKSPERITRRASHLGLVQPSHFVSISIPMPVAIRSDQQDEKLWSEVKAIINVTP
ncbi:MAG TPA: hypothetical protein PKB15_03165 [Acidimicrobiia bacterium]|nr:hypothetical protein [Acidimicrobiia bacterium]